MPRPTPWRVRVSRVMEQWVEVQAFTEAGAESAARVLPGVVNVFKPAIPAGDEEVIRTQSASDEE